MGKVHVIFDNPTYESIQVYNRSQVSVYTTIGHLVIFQGNLLINTHITFTSNSVANADYSKSLFVVLEHKCYHKYILKSTTLDKTSKLKGIRRF